MSANVLVISCVLGLTDFSGFISQNAHEYIEDALVMAVHQFGANPFGSQVIKDKFGVLM